MACGSCCISKLIQLTIIYGYPGCKVIKTTKEGKPEKLWIIYFLIIGLMSVLEGTLLFPIIFIFNKICRKLFPTLKVLFHLWLYYPEYRGALLLDQILGKHIETAFLKINPLCGKFLTILGVKNKDTAAVEKRQN